MSNPQSATNTVVVKSILDLPANEPSRAGKMDALVTYQVDPLHSFTIRIPAEGLTEQKLDAEVRADYAKRKPFINRAVSVP